MNQIWVALEYDHDEKRWVSSPTVRKVYRTVGHIRSALANGNLHWEISQESPDLIECELVHYIPNQALGRDEWRRFRNERHVSTGPALIFLEIAGKLNGNVFPKPPNLPNSENIN